MVLNPDAERVEGGLGSTGVSGPVAVWRYADSEGDESELRKGRFNGVVPPNAQYSTGNAISVVALY